LCKAEIITTKGNIEAHQIPKVMEYQQLDTQEREDQNKGRERKRLQTTCISCEYIE
jgi:hypothetical protein